ncbi:MAG: dTMP kinase [Kiritimatiellae bacterium]|jgi:dTMP kinase|nr:dTMP kinase [Kiritimatiellia bacterium]
MSKGLFITFEGPEAGGKSTQIALLKEFLEENSKDVVMTREPGGTAAGEVIRNLLQHDKAGENMVGEAETLLFEASRSQLVAEVIRPALSEGKVVISDRFADSTVAYQGYGRGFGVEAIGQLNDFATGGLKPDITFLLDISVEDGFKRIDDRNAANNTSKDRLESEAVEFHERLRDGFLEMAANEPERFVVIDAKGTIEEIYEEIRDCVNMRL